jgi:hypothetical protein
VSRVRRISRMRTPILFRAHPGQSQHLLREIPVEVCCAMLHLRYVMRLWCSWV